MAISHLLHLDWSIECDSGSVPVLLCIKGEKDAPRDAIMQTTGAADMYFGAGTWLKYHVVLKSWSEAGDLNLSPHFPCILYGS